MTEQEYDWDHHEKVKQEAEAHLASRREELWDLEQQVEMKKASITRLQATISCPQHQWKNAGSQMQMGWETCELCSVMWTY